MTTKITRLPAGLQDLLGTKALGRNPDVLDQNVSPGIDLFDLYLSQEPWLVASNTGVVAGAGNGALFEVPSQENWIIYKWHTVCTLLGPGSFSGSMFFTARSGTVGAQTSIRMGDSFAVTAVAGAVYEQSAFVDYPFYALSGNRFSYQNDGTAVVSVINSVLYKRLAT